MTLSATYLILFWAQSAFHHPRQKATVHFPGSLHSPFLYADICRPQKHSLGFLTASCLQALHRRSYCMKHRLSLAGAEHPKVPDILHISCRVYNALNKQSLLFSFQFGTIPRFAWFEPCLPSFSLLTLVMWCCQLPPHSSLSSSPLTLTVNTHFQAKLQRQWNIAPMWLKAAFGIWNQQPLRHMSFQFLNRLSWKITVIWLKWIDSPVSYCECASGKRVVLISPEEHDSPPQQLPQCRGNAFHLLLPARL